MAQIAGVIVAALGVIVGVHWLGSPRATPLPVGSRVPDLELPFATQQGTTKLSQYRGTAVLLALFDSSCDVCPSWIAELERVSRRFNRHGLAVLGIALDEDDRKVDGLLRTQAPTFFVLRDPGQVRTRAAFGKVIVPEAYLIGPDGVVCEVWHAWFAGRSPEVVAAVKRVLPKGVGPEW